MPKRYILSVSRDSAAAFTFRLSGWAITALAALALITPVLFAAGASWGARVMVSDLLRRNAVLQMENASYRDATTELVMQVATLQAAADDLGTRAAVDPQAARAMDRLPTAISRRAMGGGSAAAELTTPLATMMSSAEPAFGLLRDVLYIIERTLDEARSGVERRQALAAATPSIWPVTGWISSTYGSRTDPFTGTPAFHPGIDISADAGQPVRATADGVVRTARYSGDYGNLAVLDHGFGIGTRYGHLSRFAVVEGQQVRKGDVVGYVGSTGRSTSAHVHYELTLNGRITNPLRLLGR